MDSIPKRLAFIRGLAELKPRKLSVLAGLHPTHARLIEKGDREDPSSSATAGLARACGVEPGWLIDGIGPIIATRPELDPSREADIPAIREHIRATVEGRARVTPSDDADEEPTKAPEFQPARGGHTSNDFAGPRDSIAGVGV